MALKLNAGEDVKRGDYFFVDPYQVIVKEELRGRHKPPTPEAIVDMAESMMDHGQRQPVECRKVTVDGVKDRLMLNLGFTRTAASRLIRSGFTDADGKQRQDAEFMLKVVICDTNDEMAFVNNVVENCHRNQTSPIDDAYNQARLRDRYGKSDAEITKLYRYNQDVNKVARLRRLLSLPSAIQDLVHENKLGVQGALDLLDLPDDKRDEAIQAATAASGKVVSSKIRQQARAHMEKTHVLSDEGRDPNAGAKSGNGKPTGAKARSMKEVRDFLKHETENNQDENIQDFCATFLKFIAGQRAVKTMHDALDKLLDSERG